MDPQTTTKTEPIIPEIVVAEQEALAVQAREDTLLEQMQRLERGVEVIARRAELLTTLRKAAIALTSPTDWILFKDPQGAEVAMLAASGATKLDALLGLSLHPVGWPHVQEFTVEKISGESGVFSMRMKGVARSHTTGVEHEIIAERRSDEDFTGRQVDAAGKLAFRTGEALESDLRASVYQLLHTKAVRMVGGLVRVARQELEDCWKGSGKKTEQCRFGHGYGSSQERGAQRVAEEGVGEKAKALWDDILRRTGGDESAAHQVLKEITSYEAYKKRDGTQVKGYAGADSWQRITKENGLRIAREKLAKHAVFGDHAQQEREPGSDDQ